MTATRETLARPSSLSNAATAIFAMLGLIDVALTGVIGSPGAPPLIVSLGVAALGLITLLALVPARRDSRLALIAIVVTRVISAALAVPAFFLNAPYGSWSSRDSSSPARSPPWSWCTSRAASSHEDAKPRAGAGRHLGSAEIVPPNHGGGLNA